MRHHTGWVGAAASRRAARWRWAGKEAAPRLEGDGVREAGLQGAQALAQAADDHLVGRAGVGQQHGDLAGVGAGQQVGAAHAALDDLGDLDEQGGFGHVLADGDCG